MFITSQRMFCVFVCKQCILKYTVNYRTYLFILYVTRVCLYVTRMLLICTRMLLVCYSCYSYVTRVTRMLLVLLV